MNDDELLNLVAEAVGAPLPNHLLERAYESRAWADIDALLAELVEDSAMVAGSGTRSGENRRRLVFECQLGVVEVTANSADATLTVRAEPATSIELHGPTGLLESSGGSVTGTTFAIADGGSICLVLRADQVTWRTGWFTI